MFKNLAIIAILSLAAPVAFVAIVTLLQAAPIATLVGLVVLSAASLTVALDVCKSK